MHSPELNLIKDFNAGSFVLFWADLIENKRVSPILASLAAAEEWWLKHHFGLYEGKERRTSTVDRRKHYSERANRELSSRFISSAPDGRRYTDRAVKVDIDRSQASMLKYFSE